LDTIRFVINAGPHCFGAKPDGDTCTPGSTMERCRGSFTILPSLVAASSSNVGIWLGRCDGYVMSDVFLFGVNTGIRLGFAPHPGLNMTDPTTGKLVTAAGQAVEGSLPPCTGPWGKVSGFMVDQAEVGLHFVWPNPLSNRFSDIQLHPSFWGGKIYGGADVLSRGTGVLDMVGREGAVVVESTHTALNNNGLQPTTFFSNMIVASFNDDKNFGNASSTLGNSNGRAFTIAGDGLFEVGRFAMNNERNGDTHLWAAANRSRFSLRMSSVILNYIPTDNVVASANLLEC